MRKLLQGGLNGYLAVDLDDYDNFSSAVALTGTTSADTLMVGAYGDDDGGTNKGAVYLFAKISGSSW